MNRVILTSEICDSNSLYITKHSVTKDFTNYFFNCNMAIKLYSPRVTCVDATSVSFGFEKVVIQNEKIVEDNLALFLLLKKIESTLIGLLNRYTETKGLNNDSQLTLINHVDPKFYIRCTLPLINGRYYIHTDQSTFVKPRVGQKLKSVIIEIRNIWQNKTKSGFRLELKEIEY